jgi:predicted transposase/invertase (TIGR01784 family)
LADLITGNQLLGDYRLTFKYFKIAENEYSLETLLAIRNIVSTLFLAEAHYDIELLKQELLAVFQTEADKQAVSLFLNWFKQLSEHQRIDTEDYAQLEQVYRNVEEVKAMLITALEKEREELYEEGRQEGHEEAKAIREREIVMAMLQNGFALEVIARITGLTVAEVKEIAASK